LRATPRHSRRFELLADCALKPLQEVFHQHRTFSHFASPESAWFRIALEGTHTFRGGFQPFCYQLKVGQSFESGPAIVEEETLVLGDYELHRDSERFYAVKNGEKQATIQVSRMQTLLNLMVKMSTDQLQVAKALTNNPARAFAQDLSHFVCLRLNATTMRAACEPDLLLLPSGQNLAAALDSLSSNPEYRPPLKPSREEFRTCCQELRASESSRFATATV